VVSIDHLGMAGGGEMEDIFISYSSADAAKAEAVAQHLSAQGWSVWRYEESEPGEQFRRKIARKAQGVGCIVVLWSQAAVESPYVCSEASRGHRQKKLVPVRLEKVEIPIPFDEYQTLDLSRWQGGAGSTALDRLTAGVANVLEPATTAGLEEAARASLENLNSPLVPSVAPRALSGLFEQEVARFTGDNGRENAEPASLFAAAIDAVARRGPRTVLRIGGPAGTGAEVMAACLYSYQLGEHSSRPGQPYPIWLNLHDYDGIDSPERLLARHLDRIDRFVEEHSPAVTILVLAGFDCFTHHGTRLQEMVARRTGAFRRIVAIDRGVRSNGFAELDSGPVPGGAKRAIRLASIEAGTPEAARFIEDFARLSSNGVTAAKLSRVLRLCNFSKIDVGTLSIACAMEALDEGDLSHGGDYFYRYLVDEDIPNCSLPIGTDPLEKASGYAYDYVINGRAPDGKAQGCAEWQLVHRSEDLAHFLVAYRIAEAAMKDDPTEADIALLFHPYIHKIMSLARDVINASRGSKKRFVKRAKTFFETPDPDAVANMSFLLGRLEGEEARQDAHQLLERSRDRFLDQLSELDTPGVADSSIRSLLFSLRTLYVSLIYLGDRKASDDYIGLLLDDPRWNRINRGFHLEYYGDIEIMPVEALRRGLATPFPRTYQRLMEKIASPNRRPHFDLDVFTLYSLAQSCHLGGILEESIRAELLDRVPALMKKVRSGRLEAYLGMMQRHLGREFFGTGSVAEELYRVKKVRRQGWLDRDVKDPESVADHMYGAALLAFLYLPLQDKDEGYDRDRVLKLLLIHDLAESETGDLVDKSRAETRAESRWFAETTALSSYAELAGVGELGELWQEYEQKSTVNARIAKDFDRLDQLTQLYVYRDQVDDFQSWRAELLESIETEQGGRVLGALTAHFDN
jgi:5'-deoxynucleotidase YfbR-like HD superfamily hydrolase